MTTVADHFIAQLVASGVSRVYGLPGDSLNGFTDAIRREPAVTWTRVRHEEVAAFAAAGEAAVTGELAVCAGSCGPGNLHLINGLFEAQRSRVPVVAIAAQIPAAEIGSGYFQETHPQDLFRECSVYCELVPDAEAAPLILARAMRAAVEERGVAVVVIPGEILLADVDGAPRITPVVKTVSRTIPDADALQAAADILNSAKRVTILGGAGTEGAHAEVIRMAEALQAPIVHALRGKEFLEYDNPYDVGMTGLLGYSSGYEALKSADALLMLGTDFPYRQFYPELAQVVQVDLRGRQIGNRVPVDVPLVGTVKDTLDALHPLIAGDRSSHHLDTSVEHYRRTRAEFTRLEVDRDSEGPLLPEFVAETVSRLAADDAIFTVDVGTPTIWACRHVSVNGRRRMIGSFVHGTMACAMPMAAGAQAARPERQVIALAGDGGLTMLLGDLISLVQNKLPVKIVVFDNSALSFVELEMKAAGFVNFGTELENPDLAETARALGLFGIRVERPKDLESALQQALATPGPALVDAVVARQELAIPPHITAQQAKGFSLYGMRTLLSGGGHELLDLAETNVLDRIRDRVGHRRHDGE